jgi:hypothetical protein
MTKRPLIETLVLGGAACFDPLSFLSTASTLAACRAWTFAHDAFRPDDDPANPLPPGYVAILVKPKRAPIVKAFVALGLCLLTSAGALVLHGRQPSAVAQRLERELVTKMRTCSPGGKPLHDETHVDMNSTCLDEASWQIRHDAIRVRAVRSSLAPNNFATGITINGDAGLDEHYTLVSPYHRMVRARVLVAPKHP